MNPPNTADLAGAENAAAAKVQTLALETPSLGWLPTYDSPWGIAGIVGGVAVLGAASGGGGSSGSTPPTTSTSAEDIIKAYATSTTNTAPTLANYSTYGVKAYASLTDTSDGSRLSLTDKNVNTAAVNLTAINSAVAKLGSANMTEAKVQAAVDAYYRILSEADGNTSIDADVYNDTKNDKTNADAYDDPTAADYASIGATVGATTQSLALLNDAVGRLKADAVDTVDEINALARAAENVMLLAKGATAGATGGPALYTTDSEWVNGLAKLMDGSSGVTASNLAEIKALIDATADDGTGVDTIAEIKTLIAPVLALQTLKAFTDDTAAIGSKTAATPTLANWSDMGLTANTSLSDATRVDLSKAAYWSSTNAANGLAALNSALDTYAGTAVNKTLLQEIVDAYGRILQEADGAWSTATDVNLVPTGGAGNVDVVMADLTKVGVTGLSATSGALLSSVIGNQLSTAVDTVGELNTLATAANNIINKAEGTGTVTYSTDNDWITGINSLLRLNTSNGVSTSNVGAITTAITNAVGADLDTYVELQALVSMVRLNDYAQQKTGWTLPTITDYAAILAKESGDAVFADANSSYLNAYNSAIDYQTSVTNGEKVESMVSSYNLILGLADGNRSAPTNAPTSDSYDTVLFGASGASGVTGAGAGTLTYLLNDIINGLTVSKVDSISELKGLIATVQKIQTIATGGVATLTRDELTNIGLTDGNGHTVSDLYSGNTYWISDAEWQNFQNVQLKNPVGFANVDTWQELQKKMDDAIIAA